MAGERIPSSSPQCIGGQSPAERFAQKAGALRQLPADSDWQRLFLARATRRVRLDATISLDGTLWEVPVHLRARVVQLRYEPFRWSVLEVWYQDKFAALVGAATNSSTPKPITPPIMNAEKPSLSLALKTLWGASQMPFGQDCAEPYRYPGFEEFTRRLQLCDIGASGLLHGPNGVGKSYLWGCFTEKLPEKRYKILSLVHSSLTGSELIRALCRQLGVAPQMRRSDNVDNIHAAFAQLGSRWPLLVLEEAQNLSASALEEVQLLSCARPDTRALSVCF
jgi:hypothetical protein